MSQDPRPAIDKLELHARQQLSALVDGELSPDEARFLLRRMAHDGELSGRFERWQLCGDVLRGQVRRAAAPGLGQRIAAGIADGSRVGQSVPAPSRATRRQAWTRWGGGAALAASVAVVAMLVGRDVAASDSAPAFAPPQTLAATEAVLAAPQAIEAQVPVAPQPAPAQRRVPRDVAVAAAPGAVRAPVRRAPVQSAPEAMADPSTALADTGGATLPATDPFASSAPLQARPWPRAALPQAAGSGYTASFGVVQGQDPAPAFYPFEPRLPAQAATPGDDDPPVPQDGD